MKRLVVVLTLNAATALRRPSFHNNKRVKPLSGQQEAPTLFAPKTPLSSVDSETDAATNAADSARVASSPKLTRTGAPPPTASGGFNVGPSANHASSEDDAGASAPTTPPLPKDAKNNVWGEEQALRLHARAPSQQHGATRTRPTTRSWRSTGPTRASTANVGSSHAFLAGVRGFGRLRVRRPRHARGWKSNFRRPTPSTRCCTPVAASERWRGVSRHRPEM